MIRISTPWAAVALAALAAAPAARAIDYNWNVLGGGNQNWQSAANWSPNTNFPNSISSFANLSVGLTANLNLNLGG
ncbi:MAG TPA: hypothetical protein PJ982_16735, partial [Lacipirellulaceae bacterium]|nr:hypothetical protein [Lacipirellulaceae bacterium]